MICRDVVELMTDYLEGTLGPADLVRFEAHIADCDGCRAYLEQMRVARRLTGSIAAAQPISERLENELIAAFRDWHTRR